MPQELRDIANQRRHDEGLVALHVDDDVLVAQAELLRGLGEAIGSGSVIRARHHHGEAVLADGGGDALVVGGHVHRDRAALLCALADPHHHRLAREIGERLPRKTRRGVARRDDDGEAHASSSSGGSLRASSSSMTGMSSFTG